jgi:hypothetical protein
MQGKSGEIATGDEGQEMSGVVSGMDKSTAELARYAQIVLNDSQIKELTRALREVSDEPSHDERRDLLAALEPRLARLD